MTDSGSYIHTDTYFDLLFVFEFPLVSYFKAIKHACKHRHPRTPGRDLICTAPRPHLLGRAPPSARRLLAFFGLYPSGLSKSSGLASLAGNASLVSIADASLRGRGKKGRGRGWGREKSAKEGKRGKGNPPLFSLPPYPLPLSTPATHAS